LKIKDILRALPEYSFQGDDETELTGVVYDSRRVRPGSLFVAVRGYKTDGHDFVAEAVRHGAGAAVVERPVGAAIPQVIVPDARQALAEAAAAFYGWPGRELAVVGVTGTNGKTTVCYLLDAILRAAEHKTALFTTVANVVAGERTRARLTTGEAPEIQEGLRAARDAGADAAVLEVSSHALALHRVDGIPFAAAVFTNLSHDHLDFHGDMERYFAAKASLLAQRADGAPAIVNGDDPYGRRLWESARQPVVCFGVGDGTCDYRARDVAPAKDSSRFRVLCPDGGELELFTPLRGSFNVYNVLAAAATARELGASDTAIREGVAATVAVPGRLEIIALAERLQVVVDYAHSPDSMAKVLKEIREMPFATLVVAFGCTGERDRAKRPVMGALARRYADFTVITSDDPYDEEPAAIAAEIENGIRAAGGTRNVDYDVVLDRPAAVRRALEIAARAPGSAVVALLGKGHETVQKVAGREVPYDDRQAAAAAALDLGLLPGR